MELVKYPGHPDMSEGDEVNPENVFERLNAMDEAPLIHLSSPRLESAAGDTTFLQIEEVNPRISTAEQIKLLKKSLLEMKARYDNLFYLNEKANIDLAHERHRVIQLERKLQFVRDNRDVFERLKEAYISVKYNEAAGRRLVEIRDKNVQTWEGILCKSCFETQSLRSDLKRTKAILDNSVVVSKEQLEAINTTLLLLKDFVADAEGKRAIREKKDVEKDVSEDPLIDDF